MLLALWILACLLSVCSGAATGSSNLVVLQAQATGHGITVQAASSRHCIELCDSHPQCDAVNFHPASLKCRVFYRCSPYELHNNSEYLHYAKRPPVQEKGFVYEQDSNTCLKVIQVKTSYEVADKYCRDLNGRLASLTDPSINFLAAKLLRHTKAQYAWIGLVDSTQEGDPLHTNGYKVSETGFFPKASQQHRNDSKRNCWSLSDSGEWAEHSCKGRKQFSVCEILPF